jgi:hypothetical protein
MSLHASSSTGEDVAAAFRAARSALRAARAILLDADCRPDDAIVHIVAAWRTYLEAAGADPAMDEPVSAEVRQRVGDAVREALARLADEPVPPETSCLRADLLDYCDALERAVVSSAEQRGVPLRARTEAWRWLVRAAAWTAPVIVLLLVVIRPWEALDPGPWRAAYYPTKDFVGEPVRTRDKDIAFEWGDDAPLDSIPADRFSVRWDTCLELDEDTEVSFQLVADDGGRVYVDGERIIDDWKNARSGPRGTTVVLEAGRHHMRVEYYERTKIAKIHVLASFDDQPPGSIPSDMLSDPGEDFDEDAPCGRG